MKLLETNYQKSTKFNKIMKEPKPTFIPYTKFAFHLFLVKSKKKIKQALLNQKIAPNNSLLIRDKR